MSWLRACHAGTLNPCWCLFWARYRSKHSAHRWWHFLRSPSSHWIGWSLTNRALLPGASESGFHQQTARRGPQHLLRGLHSSPAACHWSPGVSEKASPRLSLMPRSVWMAWVWTSCKGGSEMETRGRSVFLSISCVTVVTLGVVMAVRNWKRLWVKWWFLSKHNVGLRLQH